MSKEAEKWLANKRNLDIGKGKFGVRATFFDGGIQTHWFETEATRDKKMQEWRKKLSSDTKLTKVKR